MFFYLPWYNFFTDYFFLQFLIIYTLLVFFNSKNVYYSLMYMFFLIFYFGLVLSLLQADLFTGFLWTTEFTIILIALILFFYLNVEGSILKINLKISNFYFVYFLFFFLFIFFFKNSMYNNLDCYNDLNWLFFNFYFDDWYESLNNFLMTDFISLYTTYYSVNSIEFLIIGYLLFLGSLISVSLNKSYKNLKIYDNSNFLKLFNFFNNFLNYSFLRKQTLNDQSYYDPNIRLFKKKKW